MAVIAVYSAKGGVGKTSIATNLAWCSATISCRKTLLWDLDAAGGCAFIFDVAPPLRGKAEGLFLRDSDPDQLIQKTKFPRLDLLAADETLRDLDSLFSRIGKRSRLAKLADSLSARYERIILDCPPVLNNISAQILRAADCVIVPVPPSPLSRRSFDLVVREIQSHGKKHPPILPVLSMVDLRRTLHRQAVEEQPDWPVIPFASAMEQCAVHQAPLGAFAPSSPSARKLGALWAGIERQLAKPIA